MQKKKSKIIIMMMIFSNLMKNGMKKETMIRMLKNLPLNGVMMKMMILI